MTTMSVPAPRRVVRRRARPTVDLAYETALTELPPELRPLVIQYAENMRQGQEIRSSLSRAMTRHGFRWWQIEKAARSLSV